MQWLRFFARTAPSPHLGVEAEHPLLIGDVLSGTRLPMLQVRDRDIWTTCPLCGQRQNLSQARIEPATRPHDITAYRCMNSCLVLAATGRRGTHADVQQWRFQVGDYVVAAQVPGGLQFASPADT